MDTQNLPLVEKFKMSIPNITEKEDGSFTLNMGVMYHNFGKDPDLPIIEKKVENLMKLTGEENKKGNIDSFMKRDIETDIWLLI